MTRSKGSEQIKLVADCTTAFAKGSAETLVMLTTGDDKKLQHCDTATGTFTDFVTDIDAGQHSINIAGAKAYLKSNSTTAIGALIDFGVDPVVIS
jgi:hypothetical protein